MKNAYTPYCTHDQVPVAKDEEDIEYMPRKLMEDYLKWELNTNTSKTEHLVVGEPLSNI